MTDHQFALLDRKVPVQLLLNIQFMMKDLVNLAEVDQATGSVVNLIQVIKGISFKKPAKEFLKLVGLQSIHSLLTALNRKNHPEALKDIDRIVMVQYKDSVAFEEFYDLYETIFCKRIASNPSSFTFNLQFLLHSLLQKIWKKAYKRVDSWQHFIGESKPSRMPLIGYLLESIYGLNDESSQICLLLCSLAFDSSVLTSFGQQVGDKTATRSLFNVFSTQSPENKGDTAPITPARNLPSHSLYVDLGRLIDVMLVGRNMKQLRVGAAHFLKGVYDSIPDMRIRVKDALIERIPMLKTKGVNSIELIALLSYVVNREIEAHGIKADGDLYQRLSREIFKQIQRSNQ